jgi:hypothetical protein
MVVAKALVVALSFCRLLWLRNVFYFVSTYAFWGLPAFAFALHGWQGMSRTYQRMFDDGAIF